MILQAKSFFGGRFPMSLGTPFMMVIKRPVKLYHSHYLQVAVVRFHSFSMLKKLILTAICMVILNTKCKKTNLVA